MFRKFSEETVSGRTQVKSSVQRTIRNRILETYPGLEAHIVDLFPKKAPVAAIKCPGRVQLYSINGEILFLQERNGPIFPTLRLLHRFPNMMKHARVDEGAVRHVLRGADIMCPGLTNKEKGAVLDPSMEAGDVVAIMVAEKEHAIAVGLATMSADETVSKNEGVAVTNIHYLGDGLWQFR